MKVFCILSDERAYRSKSPIMHNAVIKRNGIDAVYVPFAVDPRQLGKAVNGLRALNIAGANVTVPHKETVMTYLDRVSPEAERIGAVNTIIRYEDDLVGDNTDAGGFLDALGATGWSARDKRALVVGAGGVAKAVVFALKSTGISNILITDMYPEKARQLARTFDLLDVPLDTLSGGPLLLELVVNATSVSSPDEGPNLATLMKDANFDGCELVVDVNYGRVTNFWKHLADRLAAKFMDGLPMLAYQARRSFALWTGMEAPLEEFLEALGERP
jgi:shikimate dehydrogenase